jgi:hypothetical protein
MLVVTNKVEWPHRKWAKVSGRTLLFDNSWAKQIVVMAKDSGVGVFGIDSFQLFDKSVRPDQSIDTSSISAEAHNTCISFLEERQDLDLWYEVVLDAEKIEIEF